MLLKSLEFALLTFGITVVVAALVALLIKAIASFVQRGKQEGSHRENGPALRKLETR